MWKLQILDDGGQRSEVVLEDQLVTIGRNDVNTIRLPERNVSRSHARLIRENGHVFIEDCGSSFGTLLNGDSLAGRHQLNAGDEVTIGDYHLLVWYERAEAGPAVPELDSDGLYQLGRARLIPMDQRARLTVMTGSQKGTEFTLDRTPILVGRHEDAAVRLRDHKLFEREALIHYEGGEFFIEDHEGTARIEVNNEIVHHFQLAGDDEVTVGGVKMRFVSATQVLAATKAETITEMPSAATATVAAAAEEAAQSSGPGFGRYLALGIMAVGIGLVAAYFLYYNRPVDETAPLTPTRAGTTVAETGQDAPTEATPTGEAKAPEPVAVAANTPRVEGAAAPANAVAPSTGAEPAGTAPPEAAAAVEPAPDPDAGRKEAVNKALALAKDAEDRKDFQVAADHYSSVRDLDPATPGIDEAIVRVETEVERQKALGAIRSDLEAGRTADAYAAWSALPDAPQSVTRTEAEELGKTVSAAYVGALVKQGEAQLAKNPSAAGDLAQEALEVDPDSASAKQLEQKVAKAMRVASAKSARNTGKPPKSKSKTKSTRKNEPSTKAKKASKEQAKVLYREARTAYMSNQLGVAMQKYKAAASLGFPKAHKQIGIIFGRQGNNKSAVKHYELYLRKLPNAPDADAVRASIARLR